MPAGFALLPAMSGHPPPPDEARRGPTRPDQARPGPAGSCSQSSLRIFFNFVLASDSKFRYIFGVVKMYRKLQGASLSGAPRS